MGYYEPDPDLPDNSHICMALTRAAPRTKPSPQQGERANTRLKQLNRGTMPISFGLDLKAPPPPTDQPSAPPVLQATFQNLSLNLGKLDELGRQAGIVLFEHHLAAPLPLGASSAPLFQSLFEAYLPPPVAPTTQGVSAAVVHASELAADSAFPTPPAEVLPSLASTSTSSMSDQDGNLPPADSAEEEGAGYGLSPPPSPVASPYPSAEPGYLHCNVGVFPASSGSRQVTFQPSVNPINLLGAAPESLISYNAKRATLHYAANPDHAHGITLLLGDDNNNPLGLLPLTLLDSGANTSIVTRQYCLAHNVPYNPCSLRLNTASGAASPVLGKVTLPAKVVFAMNTVHEAYTPLTLFVVEGSTPAVFELLLSTEVLRVVGAYVDPLHEVLVYRPSWQSHGDADSYALLPVSITTPRSSANTMLATVSLHSQAEVRQVRGTHPLYTQ